MRTGRPAPVLAALVLGGALLLAGLLACSTNGGGGTPGEGGTPGSEPPEASSGGSGPLGCWALDTEDESVGDSLQVWLSGEMLPPIVELDSLPTPAGTEADGPYRAFSRFDGRRETSPFSEWQPMAGDSIRVQRTGALSGLMLRMAQREDRLEGRLIVFTDVGGPGDPGRREVGMVARRVGCP